MRTVVFIGLAMAMTSVASAQGTPVTAHNTPDDIVCKLSGSCGDAQPNSSQQIKVGDEKAFSLARPSTIKVPTATASPSFVAPTKVASKAPARRSVASASASASSPATASGGLDMQVTFNTGSADLTDQGKAEARAFAEAMKAPALASMKFNVDGHTDAVGNRDYNLDLSKRRAQSVTAYLVAQGVDPSRVEPHGFGFDKPRPGSVATAAANRRVEFSRAN